MSLPYFNKWKSALGWPSTVGSNTQVTDPAFKHCKYIFTAAILLIKPTSWPGEPPLQHPKPKQHAPHPAYYSKDKPRLCYDLIESCSLNYSSRNCRSEAHVKLTRPFLLHWIGRSWLGVVARTQVKTFRQSNADGIRRPGSGFAEEAQRYARSKAGRNSVVLGLRSVDDVMLAKARDAKSKR